MTTAENAVFYWVDFWKLLFSGGGGNKNLMGGTLLGGGGDFLGWGRMSRFLAGEGRLPPHSPSRENPDIYIYIYHIYISYISYIIYKLI